MAGGIPRLADRFARTYGLTAARGYGGAAWLLAAGSVVSYLGRGAAVPFVTLYLTGSVGIALAALAVGIVAEQLVRALTSPVFGALSDKYGRKPFLVGGLVLQAATFPAYLLVDSVSSFVLVSILAGLGQSPYQPALSAYVADVTPASQRVGVFGLIHMTKNLGWGLGIVVGAFLITKSFWLLFLFGGALPLVYAVLLLVFLKEAPREARAPAPGRVLNPLSSFAFLANPRFAAFVALATVIFLTWGQLNSVLPIFVTDGLLLDATWVSRAFAVNSVLIILLQVPISTRAESWSRTRGLALASGVTAAGYLCLAATLWLAATQDAALAHVALLVSVGVLTMAEMIDTPLTFTLAAELAPAGMKGGAMGVLGLAAPLGMGAAPLLAGVITASRSWMWVWVAYAAIVTIGALGFLALGRSARRAATASPDEPAPGSAS